MKKKLLFVLNNLNCGGAEKALISLLETLDYDQYDVDLFLFKHEGMFMNKIPQKVCLLPESKYFRYFDMSFKKAIFQLLKNGALSAILSRIHLGYLIKQGVNGGLIEQLIWKQLSPLMEKLNKTYDVAIGFLEKTPIYFCIDNVKARKKIGWIHTNYNKLNIDKEFDKNYFEKLDYVVTVSDELVSIVQKNFPDISNRVKSIKNIISPNVIYQLSNEKADYEFDNSGISIVSVGRLVKEKGLDLSLEAIELLIKKKQNINWYLVGEGNMRSYLEREIYNRNLQNNVKLLGAKENPYPYIKSADIYIQTSRYEGKSISIMEAKILNKPILITNFDTAKDHINHEWNGLITDMNALSIANSLERLVVDKQLREQFSNNLLQENFSTESEIIKFYNLITA